VHLYIHVPFCARKCSYCDFAIAVRRITPSGRFLDAVLWEWQAWQTHPAWVDSPELETIYLGGGTPSRLDPEILGELLGRIRSDRPVAAAAEVTLEANPDDVTPSRVALWMEAGINRYSLGAQSFSPAALEWMHRTHSADQTARAVGVLHASGIRNVSLDLIYGLPESIQRNWADDLEEALSLSPTHLSLYGLTVEPRTPVARWVTRGESTPPPERRAAEEYLAAHERLASSGYHHYEVSNAARPGFRSAHNQAYWGRHPYLGLGPSAHSSFGQTRSWNVREWEEYQKRAAAGERTVAGSEMLSADEIALEELYLGLRTCQGVPEASVGPGPAARWRDEGWAVAESGRIRLTPEGWLRLDALVASLTRC
jgi:oxygen-independent coproporphyrinogen-3 oxidase